MVTRKLPAGGSLAVGRRAAAETEAVALEIDRGDEVDTLLLAPGVSGEKRAGDLRTTKSALLVIRRGGREVLREER